jgi:hypothetical protein
MRNIIFNFGSARNNRFVLTMIAIAEVYLIVSLSL